jgi:hypothetical protein
MNKLTRLISVALIALFAVGLVACKKEAPAKVAAPPVAKPANEDVNAWQEYVTDVVRRNVEPGTSPYLYFLPGASTADFQGEYDRLQEKLDGDLGRGITGDNVVLAFASPTSSKLADMMVDSFGRVEAGSLKGARVMFIGDAADSQRVEPAVTPSGATYKFVDAK